MVELSALAECARGHVAGQNFSAVGSAHAQEDHGAARGSKRGNTRDGKKSTNKEDYRTTAAASQGLAARRMTCDRRLLGVDLMNDDVSKWKR